jgi:tRNA-binding protein
MTPAPVKPRASTAALEALDIRVGAINLEPRTMLGEVSEAMLFDLGYADGVTPVRAVPEAPVPNGTRAG